jgi:simple sugar transport system permease protein
MDRLSTNSPGTATYRGASRVVVQHPQAPNQPGPGGEPDQVVVVESERVNPLIRLLLKPAATALLAAVVVFVFFALIAPAFATPAGIANWLSPAAEIGTVAALVALLMIDGEFDLSAGITIGTTGIAMALLSTHFHWSVPAAMLGALVVAILIGLTNGALVVTTGLPSFIVTLAMFFSLQGLNVGVSTWIAGNVVVFGVNNAAGFAIPHAILGSTITIGGAQLQISVLWWIVVTLVASWILLRTKYGNWIQCIGGNVGAARATGIPVGRTKIALFVATSCAAWLVGMETALRLGSAQANEGLGLELQFVVAATVGGCLLFGGHGSVIGTALGALVFGMIQLGITYARWPAQLYLLFLGIMLFAAVLANTLVRQRLTRGT